jgi:hypothetical protein
MNVNWIYVSDNLPVEDVFLKVLWRDNTVFYNCYYSGGLWYKNLEDSDDKLEVPLAWEYQ